MRSRHPAKSKRLSRRPSQKRMKKFRQSGNQDQKLWNKLRKTTVTEMKRRKRKRKRRKFEKNLQMPQNLQMPKCGNLPRKEWRRARSTRRKRRTKRLIRPTKMKRNETRRRTKPRDIQRPKTRKLHLPRGKKKRNQSSLNRSRGQSLKIRQFGRQLTSHQRRHRLPDEAVGEQIVGQGMRRRSKTQSLRLRRELRPRHEIVGEGGKSEKSEVNRDRDTKGVLKFYLLTHGRCGKLVLITPGALN